MQHLARAMVLGMLGVGIVGVSVTQADDARSRPKLQVPQGAGVTAAAIQASGQPGQVFPVDVYLSNIPDLGAYQLLVKATGGTQGTLTVQDLAINRDRKDYVFGQAEIVDVVSKHQNLLAAV